MIRPAPLHELVHNFDFVPQAIIGERIDSLIKRMGAKIEFGYDDLDEYQGAAAWLDASTPFAVMHYKGHPDDEVTLYLPYSIEKVNVITQLILRIAAELDLPLRLIIWQRKDNPDL